MMVVVSRAGYEAFRAGDGRRRDTDDGAKNAEKFIKGSSLWRSGYTIRME